MRLFPSILPLAVAAGAFMASGLHLSCAHDPKQGQVFSDDWIHTQRVQRNLEKKQEPKRSFTLFGSSDKTRGAVKVDEKGRPKLNIGREEGLSINVGSGATLEYTRRLKFGTPSASE
jgi:hypothetical protein